MEAPGASVRERDLIFPLVDHFGRDQVDSIDQDALDRYIRQRYPAGSVSAATILRHVITPMSAILNHAARRGWCSAPKFDRPKQSKGRWCWATGEEVAALVAAASPHMRSLILFLAFTGARVSEALYLDWSNVDLQQRWVIFRDTKNGEDRGVPLHEEAFLALANLARREGRVFLTQRGLPYAEKTKRGGGQTKTAWQATCRRAGVQDLHMHDLRHTFSTWLTIAGVHEQVRDELMGHASTDMDRRYSHVARPMLVKAVNKLPRLPRVKSVQRAEASTKKPSKNKAVTWKSTRPW